MYVSKLTAALFRDSGWYLTNDTLAHDLKVGAGVGCKIVEDFLNCSPTDYPSLFCDPDSSEKDPCDPNGYCSKYCGSISPTFAPNCKA